MSSGQKQKRLTIAYNPAWLRRTDFNTPMDLSDLTAAMLLDDRRWPGTTLTFKDTRGCTGQHLIKRILASRVMRWSLALKGSAQNIAGAASLVYGAAANPSGTPADEAQTITINATGGTFTIAFTFEGLTDTTPALAWNAPAAVVQAALENLRSIKAGNVTVGLSSLVYTITFTGALAKANVPALVTAGGGLTGGAQTAVVATTVPGVQHSHAITRLTGEQGPAIDVVVGFDGEPDTYVRYNQIVGADLKVTATRRQDVTCALGVRGSAKVELVPDFVMPSCANQTVIEAKDCRAEVDGVFYPDIVRQEFNGNAGIFDGDDAFPFDDVDVERLEQGDTWEPTYAIDTYGTNASPLYLLGQSNVERAVALHFGQPGSRVSFSAANAVLQLTDDNLTFSGQANRSTIPLVATPLEVNGAAPDSVSARVPQSTAFMSA